MKSTGHIQRVYYVILAFFWFSTALPLALLVLIHQTRGLDLFNVGILMGTYSLTIVFLEVPTGGLADAVGRKKVTQIAYAISFISGLVFLPLMKNGKCRWYAILMVLAAILDGVVFMVMT